jgi:hypothetical protein
MLDRIHAHVGKPIPKGLEVSGTHLLIHITKGEYMGGGLGVIQNIHVHNAVGSSQTDPYILVAIFIFVAAIICTLPFFQRVKK